MPPPEHNTYYNHKYVLPFSSLGTFYDGLRVPALLFTVLYRLDPKTFKLAEDIFLHIQVDGPSDAQLNFPHSLVENRYDHQGGCVFDISMDIIFGQGNTLSRTIKGGAELGFEGKLIKGGAEGSYEAGKQYADTQTILHGRLHGVFDSKAAHNRLQVSGNVLGDALRHRVR